MQNLPGLTSAHATCCPRCASFAAARSRSGRADDHVKDQKKAATATQAELDKKDLGDPFGAYQSQKELLHDHHRHAQDSVIPKVRHVLETLRPGSIFFWDGDGAMSHDDQMRSLRLMGSDVIPAVREMADELDLKGPFEIDPAGEREAAAAEDAPESSDDDAAQAAD